GSDKRCVKVTKERAKEAMETAKSENEVQLNAYLEEFQLTEEMCTDQIWLGLLVEKYMDEALQIDEVTNDEIQETYDELKKESEELPDFDELKEDLKKQLETQK